MSYSPKVWAPQEYWYREFPDGLVIRIPGFHGRGLGSTPGGQGTEIPQVVQQGQKKGFFLIFKTNTDTVEV